jgi:hypothetical protein
MVQSKESKASYYNLNSGLIFKHIYKEFLNKLDYFIIIPNNKNKQ